MQTTRTTSASLSTLKTLNKVLGILSMVGWLFFIVALYMFHYAAPDPSNLYDSILGNQPNLHWDATYADLFIFFMSIGIGITLIALTLNIYLYRAKRTHIWINLMLLLLSSVPILFYFVRSIGSA